MKKIHPEEIQLGDTLVYPTGELIGVCIPYEDPPHYNGVFFQKDGDCVVWWRSHSPVGIPRWYSVNFWVFDESFCKEMEKNIPFHGIQNRRYEYIHWTFLDVETSENNPKYLTRLRNQGLPDDWDYESRLEGKLLSLWIEVPKTDWNKQRIWIL